MWLPLSLFLRRKKAPDLGAPPKVRTLNTSPIPLSVQQGADENHIVRRYFYNQKGFQTYASFFAHWQGHITAGHVMDDCGHQSPPFAGGDIQAWPAGLDAAVLGCTLPDQCPPDPVAGQDIICWGYPAGSSHLEQRTSRVYMKRPGSEGAWIAHIFTPDEPVVSGMSGGAVVDTKTGEPIGIIITRNSPADLNQDRDPDESFDFIALSNVWRALKEDEIYV